MINEKVFEEMALMVTRQTELSLEEAKNKLKENNYDYMSVIKNEMGIKKKNDTIRPPTDARTIMSLSSESRLMSWRTQSCVLLSSTKP